MARHPPSPSYLDRTGIVPDAPRRLAAFGPICSTVAVARRVFEAVGGFAPDLRFTPDWEMWARLAAFGPICYIHQPRAAFRLRPTPANGLRTLKSLARGVRAWVRRRPRAAPPGTGDTPSG